MARPTVSGARRDPSPRPSEPTVDFLTVRQKDKNREYCLVHKASQDRGLDYYGYLGYEAEVGRDKGPKWAMGKTAEGQPIERNGYVLMSISKADYDQIQEEGALGGVGRRAGRELESKILNVSFAAGSRDLPSRIDGPSGPIADFEFSAATQTVMEMTDG